MREEIQYFRPEAMSGPLRLHLAGVSYCDASYRIRRGPQKIFVFEAVSAGHGYLEVDGQKFHPAAGDVYIAPGWRPHAYGSDAADPWTKSWFNLSGPLVENLLRTYGLEETFLFRGADAAARLIETGVEALKKIPAETREAFISERLFQMVRALAETGKERSPRSPSLTPDGAETPGARMRDFLRRRVMENAPTLAELAAHIGRSEAQAIRLFRKETAMTPHAFLLAEKLEAAAALLRNTGKSVKEIAAMLAFRDEFYFSRLFREKRGVSPRYYRRGHE